MGLCILILCIVIISQKPCYGRSASTLSNFSHYNIENSLIQRESHEDRTRNVENLLRSLNGTIRANHDARKAAFLEKELEICLGEIERCNLTTVEVESLREQRDHLASTVPSIEKVDRENCTKAGNGNPEDLRDQNANLTKPSMQLQESVIFLRKKQAKSSKIEEDFLSHDHHGWNVSIWIEKALWTVKVKVLKRVEKYNIFHRFQLKIRYEDAAKKVTALLSKEELVYVDYLLAEMRRLNLVAWERKPTKKLKLPLPIEELRELITPRMVHWFAYLLFIERMMKAPPTSRDLEINTNWGARITGKMTGTTTLRSMVKSEPNLSLFEFCWSISRIWDAAEMVTPKEELGMGCILVSKVIEDCIATRKEVYGSAGPLLQSLKILLTKCEDLEEKERGELYVHWRFGKYNPTDY